jgi:hypothetical protein
MRSMVEGSPPSSAEYRQVQVPLPLHHPSGGSPPHLAMGRKAGGGRLADRDDDRLRVVHDVMSGEADDLDALLAEPGVAALVTSRIVAHVVTDAIQLDPEPRRGAIEIQRIPARRMLVPELETVRTRPQQAP